MGDRYIFRAIRKEEIQQMYQMILDRMDWMDEVGIRQWNVTHYDTVYPLSYYEQKRIEGEAFVLEDTRTGEIVCAGVLKKEDDRWPTEAPALYLHHFVTKVEYKGVGAIFLELAEQYVLSTGRSLMRLDSAVGNTTLADYYGSKGYMPVGTCVDGLYKGILREKVLRRD